MPEVEVSAVTPSLDERPIVRAGTAPGVNAFLPSAAPVAPVVPIHPRKQSRH
jgi:hypothetical protein